MENKTTIKAMYHALMNGAYLTDQEVIILKDHFKLVSDACEALGALFYLPFMEATMRYNELCALANKRGLDKKAFSCIDSLNTDIEEIIN